MKMVYMFSWSGSQGLLCCSLLDSGKILGCSVEHTQDCKEHTDTSSPLYLLLMVISIFLLLSYVGMRKTSLKLFNYLVFYLICPLLLVCSYRGASNIFSDCGSGCNKSPSQDLPVCTSILMWLFLLHVSFFPSAWVNWLLFCSSQNNFITKP
jgi:hypothetical protein